MSPKIYLFANWKMYLGLKESVVLAKALAKKFKKLSPAAIMAVFPSALAFTAAQPVLAKTKIHAGVQNVHWLDRGGYTGEISAPMCKEAGGRYVLVGHSERRNLFHETNHETRRKMEAVLNAGLTPVLCVGETWEERKSNLTKEVVEAQLRSAFDGLNWPKGRQVIIAYEPVWAISRGIGPGEAGRHCDDVEAEKMHRFIKKLAGNLLPGQSPAVLFGGSVRPDTAGYYLKQPSIDGVLVGAGSTKLSSWTDIVQASLSR